MKVYMQFAKGGKFELELLYEDAPKTCAAFMAMLPYHSGALQARFSGNDFFFRMPLGVPQENICVPKMFDLAFNSDEEQAICIYYGINIRHADPPYNRFAVVRGDAEELETVAMRIWKEGMEEVTVFAEEP